MKNVYLQKYFQVITFKTGDAQGAAVESTVINVSLQLADLRVNLQLMEIHRKPRSDKI